MGGGVLWCEPPGSTRKAIAIKAKACAQVKSDPSVSYGMSEPFSEQIFDHPK